MIERAGTHANQGFARAWRGIVDVFEAEDIGSSVGVKPDGLHRTISRQGKRKSNVHVDQNSVVSTRGGDFELIVGQDLSVGYASHTAATVSLYLVESMTFRILSPEAAVWLRYRS